MTRERFVKLVAEVLDSLPDEFRERIPAVVIEGRERPSKRPRRPAGKAGSRKTPRLVLGVFQNVPATQSTGFDLCSRPDGITLYQNNI